MCTGSYFGLLDSYMFAMHVSDCLHCYRWLYWASFTHGSIEQASMDGSSRTLLYSTQNSTILQYGLTLDYETQTLYWTETSFSTIKRSGVNGSNQEELLQVMHFPFGIVFLRGKLYWAADFRTSGNTDNIFSTTVDSLGSASELVSNSMIESPLAIQVISQDRQPEGNYQSCIITN